YCVLPTPPHQGAVPLASLNGIPQMKVYECHPSARRVSVVPDALIGPDVPWQIEGLFQERFDPSRGVLVSDRPPDPVGIEGPAAPASARARVSRWQPGVWPAGGAASRDPIAPKPPVGARGRRRRHAAGPRPLHRVAALLHSRSDARVPIALSVSSTYCRFRRVAA